MCRSSLGNWRSRSDLSRKAVPHGEAARSRVGDTIGLAGKYLQDKGFLLNFFASLAGPDPL